MVNSLEFFIFMPVSNEAFAAVLRKFSSIFIKLHDILILEQRFFLFIATLNNEG